MKAIATPMPYESTHGLSYEQWQNNRSQYIGGSEVAAVLGESSYKTPLQVWKEKTGAKSTFEDSGIMEFGRAFEPHLAQKFMDMTNLKVQNDYKTRIHKHYDFLRANVDRVILSSEQHPSPGILELKTTNSYSVKEWTEAFPIEWQYQIQYYLLITGYQYAYLQVYERDTCKYHKPILIERDETLINHIESEVVKWWYKHIIGGIQPEPQNNEDVLILYPSSTDGKVARTSLGGYANWSELRRIKVDIKELEEVAGALEMKLKQEIGDGDELWFNDLKLCTWKTVKQRRFDSKSFEKEDPEYYDSFIKPTSYRRFNLN